MGKTRHIQKYTVKKELEKKVRYILNTENVVDFITALANELGDENYKSPCRKANLKIMENDNCLGT